MTPAFSRAAKPPSGPSCTRRNSISGATVECKGPVHISLTALVLTSHLPVMLAFHSSKFKSWLFFFRVPCTLHLIPSSSCRSFFHSVVFFYTQPPFFFGVGSPEPRAASVFIPFDFAWFLQYPLAERLSDLRVFYRELTVLKGSFFTEVVAAVRALP